jgi:hypothetical protein
VDGLVGEALAARRAVAEEDLRAALRLDATRLLASEVEARLRSRPHFLAAFPAPALIQLRRELDSRGGELADDAWAKLTDLRVWFGAEGGTEPDEAAALSRAVEPFAACALELLQVYGFPGDSAPDEAAAGLDLDASYTVDYRPSPQLEWAWRRLRALDTARNALVDGESGFEVAFHLPEGLRE